MRRSSLAKNRGELGVQGRSIEASKSLALAGRGAETNSIWLQPRAEVGRRWGHLGVGVGMVGHRRPYEEFGLDDNGNTLEGILVRMD